MEGRIVRLPWLLPCPCPAHFTSERSLGAGELWMYHKTGGAGLQLTKKKNDQQDLGEPAVSADGRYVYYSEDVSGGTTFEYNKNPHGVIYAIKRLDRETGETETIVATPGGAVRPQPSPDGKSLAFVKRVADKSVLHRIDLAIRARSSRCGMACRTTSRRAGQCSVRMRTTSGCRIRAPS
jgi:Tol biopolymer transport system component